jgi:hypothetical protein
MAKVRRHAKRPTAARGRRRPIQPTARRPPKFRALGGEPDEKVAVYHPQPKCHPVSCSELQVNERIYLALRESLHAGVPHSISGRLSILQIGRDRPARPPS